MASKEMRHAPGLGRGAEIKSGGGKILAIPPETVKHGRAVPECKVLLPFFDAIPQKIKDIPRWVVWRLEPTRGGGKPSKRPFCPMSGRPMSTSSRSYRCAFTEAKRVCQKGGWSGVGLVLAPEDGLVWFDLDHVRDVGGGDLLPDAQDLVTALGSYTEVSPSGTGLRLVARGSLPPGTKQNRRDAFGPGTGLEVYDGKSARFLTITGHQIGQEGIEDRQAGIDAILGKFMRPVTATPDPSNDRLAHVRAAIEAELAENPDSTLTAADTALVERLKQSPRFGALWDGDTSDYPSGSEADVALCARIARAVGDDPGRIDRIYRNAGLLHNPARTKEWDDQRGGGLTYGSLTIAAALQYVAPDLAFDRFADPEPPTELCAEHLKAKRFFSSPPKPIRFVAEGLPAGCCAILGGPEAALKSTLALSLAAAIATGASAVGGVLEVFEHGPVLIVSAEDPEAVLHNRLAELHDELKLRATGFDDEQGWDEYRRKFEENLYVLTRESVSGPVFMALPERNDVLAPTKLFERLLEIAEGIENLKLIIFDTRSRCWPGDENSTTLNSQIVAQAEQLCDRTGAAALLLHHVGKAATTAKHREGWRAALDPSALRGGSPLANNSRAVLMVSPLPREAAKKMGHTGAGPLVCLRVAKNSYGEAGREVFLTRTAGGGVRAFRPSRAEPDLLEKAISVIVIDIQKSASEGRQFSARELWRDRTAIYKTSCPGLTQGLVRAALEEAKHRGVVTEVSVRRRGQEVLVLEVAEVGS